MNKIAIDLEAQLAIIDAAASEWVEAAAEANEFVAPTIMRQHWRSDFLTQLRVLAEAEEAHLAVSGDDREWEIAAATEANIAMNALSAFGSLLPPHFRTDSSTLWLTHQPYNDNQGEQ